LPSLKQLSNLKHRMRRDSTSWASMTTMAELRQFTTSHVDNRQSKDYYDNLGK